MDNRVKNGALILVAVAFLVCNLAAAFADELQPSMFIPKMRHDFGNVFEQEKFEYDFVVKNRGKADLIIQNVKPG
jgi:hypothetical protein